MTLMPLSSSQDLASQQKIRERQKNFIEDVRLSNALSDALRTRGGRRVFKKKSEDSEGLIEQEKKQRSKRWDQLREDFKDDFKAELRNVAANRVSAVGDVAHITDIRGVATRLSKKYSEILNGDKLVFGVAQKAINVYLKSLWCDNSNVKPPHCPFDRDILERLKLPDGCSRSWTGCDDEDSYQKWVSAARIAAVSRSLSEWELEEWEAAQMRKKGRAPK
jgi:hypothetical protein